MPIEAARWPSKLWATPRAPPPTARTFARPIALAPSSAIRYSAGFAQIPAPRRDLLHDHVLPIVGMVHRGSDSSGSQDRSGLRIA
jgi:hypothetical protein